MRIGIVGSEAAKFTPETEKLAKAAIGGLLHLGGTVISGECHLGGIDIWAKEIAHLLGVGYIGFPPRTNNWSGGYKERNIQIAGACDKLVCITVKELPPGYNGMKFDLCYHCKTNSHVKSGGCWTMKYAEQLGKDTQLIVI